MGTSAVDECITANAWGPVRRGFSVWLPDGRRGAVYDIRHSGGGGVEFVVATGLFLRTLVTVRPPEIEAILPRLRRIIVGEADVGGHETGLGSDVEKVGGIVRMPVRESPPIDSPPDAA